MFGDDGNDLLAKDTIFVPLLQVANRLVSLGVKESFTVILSSNAKVLIQLIEGHTFLLVVLSVEGEHVLVLADEVIVDNDLKLFFLVNATDSTMHLSDHICVPLTCPILTILELLIIFLAHWGTSIPLPLNALTIGVEIFFQFSVISIDELAQKTLKLSSFVLHLAIAQGPRSEVKVLRTRVAGAVLSHDRLLYANLRCSCICGISSRLHLGSVCSN